MDDKGNILNYSEVLKLPENQQKKFIPIPDNYFNEVRNMNRADRRAWYKKNRSKSNG